MASPQTKIACQCKVCQFASRVARVQAKLNKQDQAVIEELMLKWESAATDSGYWQAKFKGTWPNGPLD